MNPGRLIRSRHSLEGLSLLARYNIPWHLSVCNRKARESRTESAQRQAVPDHPEGSPRDPISSLGIIDSRVAMMARRTRGFSRRRSDIIHCDKKATSTFIDPWASKCGECGCRGLWSSTCAAISSGRPPNVPLIDTAADI